MSEPRTDVGAMTKAMQAMPMGSEREVVRLGCLLADGKLEERTVRLDAPLHLDGLFSSISAISPLQKSHVLMTRDARSIVTLHLSAGMTLRLVGEDAVIEGPRGVMLAPRARGRIQVDGGKTLLFQLVPEPQKRAKASLPSSVMRGFFAQTDALFTFIVLASFTAHFGAIVVMESADFPMDPGVSHVPDRVAELIFNEPTPPEVPPPAPTVTDETPTHVAEMETAPTPDQPTHTERPTHTTTPSNTPMSREDAALVAQNAANLAVNQLIGAMGGNGLRDLIANGAPTQDQASLLAGVEGTQLAGTDATHLRTREGGGPVQTDIGSLRSLAVRPGQVQEGRTMVETGPRVSVSIPQTDDVDPIDGAGEFDARIVARMISTRRAQITACYEHAITRSPDLHGRVVVQLTIQENGSVTGVHTTDNTMGSDEVARCVESRIRNFRFTPGPEGGSVNFSFPFVFERQD